jgi:hypothetical protein
MHPLLSIIQQQRRATSGGGYRIVAGEFNGRLWYYDGNWTEVRPAGDVNKQWAFCKFDKQGSGAMIAGVKNGRVYHSSDWGANWSEMDTLPGELIDRDWRDGAIDGSKMVLAEMGGKVYCYGWNGAYWEISDLESGNYQCVDLFGNQILAGEYPGRLWLTDFSTGPQEVDNNGAQDRNWKSVSINGSAMAAAVYGGRLFLHIEGGWGEQQPRGNTNSFWQKVVIQDDQTAIAAALYTSVYSFDGERNWIDENPSAGASSAYYTCALSGNYMVAGTQQRLYKNENGWAETQPNGDVNIYWICSDMIQVE